MPLDPSRLALVSVIDALLAIAGENRKSTPLAPQRFAEVLELDARLYALCQQTQLLVPEYAEPEYGELLPGSHLAYYTQGAVVSGDGVGHEGGIRLAATREWRQAMHCLRAAAALQPVVLGQPQVGSDKSNKQRGKRGRPPGSPTAEDDRKLYLDWQAAHRATRITKAEFLRERGLPESRRHAIERGRAQEKRKRSGRK